MSDTDAAPPRPGPADEPADRFDSASALRGVHQTMLERQAGTETEPPQVIPAAEISAFLARAGATGAVIDDPEDRRAVQRILGYWSADLLAASRATRMDAGPAQLAPYVSRRRDAAEDAAIQRPEDARQYIRLSALARQWRDSGAQGYLLTGDALLEAEKFARDPDVAALIAASRDAQRDTVRRRQRFRNVLMAVMAVVIIVLSGLSWRLFVERGKAWQDREEANALRRVADERARKAEASLAESKGLLQNLQMTTDIAAERLARLDRQQAVLDDALDELGRQVAGGSLDPSGLQSNALRSALLASRAYTVGSDDGLATPPGSADGDPSALSASLAAATGYDADFLDFQVPLPALTSRQAQTAYNGGEPIPYFNFSLVLDPQLRLPVFAAANLDRLRSRSLPRVSDPSLFRPDPRIPAEAQPDAADVDASGVAGVLLVERWDISWGARLPHDTAEAASFVAQMTRFQPNVIPQYLPMAESWNAVAEWVRLRHNPGAARVTIFMGPVFGQPDSGDDDDGNDSDDSGDDDDMKMPVALWKIAVSTQASVSKGPADAPLVVDAFLVPNDRSPARDAEDYRVTVDEIVVRTGLRFPAAIGNATRDGEVLASRLAAIGGSDEARRERLAQDILALLRSPTASGADQRTVVEALLQMAGSASVAGLSPQGQTSLFSLLSQVPAMTWDRQSWVSTRAAARRAVADLQAEMDPEASRHLDTLRERLGLADPFPQTVYLQFAGLTRENAAAIGARLRALGWTLPGEERVEPRVNQVRYNPSLPADAAAARLLAADLAAAGQAGVVPQPLDIIKPGVLEVWISR